MSVAASVYGTSSGSEGGNGDPQSVGLKRGTTPSPAAFVCQRCLRLLDMFPLYAEMVQQSEDFSASSDLLKSLERGDAQRPRHQVSQSSDSLSRSASQLSSDMRASMGPSTYVSPSGASMASRLGNGLSTAPRKKRNEPVISRTLSTVTNFFKSGSSSSVSSNAAPQIQTPSSNITNRSIDQPLKGSAMPVPARASPGDDHQHGAMLMDDEETGLPREEDDGEDEPILLGGSAAPASSIASTPSPNSSMASGAPIQLQANRDSHDDSLEDDDWTSVATPPSLSASVSRASMRERVRAPSFMPKGSRRTLRNAPNNLSTSDYVSKRFPTNRDFNSSGPALASSSSSISSQAISKAAMRRMCSVIELATVETGVDFPLCSECSMDVLGELNAEMYDTDMEIDAYEQELALMSHPYFTESTHERDIAKMAFSLEQCERDIRTTEAEILHLSEKERSLSAKGIELMVSKSEYWRTFEIHAADREAMLENMISAHNRLTHAKKWLDLVRSSHVVNDAFHVSLDLHLATINGLRVGRLPSAPVEWPEISAALGFTLQMLHEIALRASFAFTKYRIVVDGSFSGLYKLPNGGFMALHSDSDISLVRLVQFQGVNAAMSALVECVSELADFLRTLDGSFCLPFSISKDLVGGVSIKRAWNSSGATWSTALRSLMANMKFILAWEAKQGLCV